jgi:hypothetical protein
MVQRREHLRFAPETPEAVWILGKRIREHFERDTPIQFEIVAAIHLPHPARADEFANFIDAETTTERKRHPRCL